MAEPVIRVENLGKCYRIHHETRERYTALRDVISRKAAGLFGKLKSRKQKAEIQNAGGSDPFQLSQFPISAFPAAPAADEDFWALKDVSFEVNQGDVVGIIGRNGAGKSTLLKILSRITEPTKGRITLSGRVASLLEVGTGFHPELTGRENIYLNGAILGMTKVEIRSKFDEIVAFAEVEKFLDTPVKRYSSGMYVRLAFAVAAHLETEILVIDEVLAVGDAAFQKKCMGKMQDVARGEGRTILFVSHNIGAVASLCTRGLLLKAGLLKMIGDTQAAIHEYLADGMEQGYEVRFADNHPGSGDDVVRVRGARVRSLEGMLQGSISVGESAWVEVDYDLLKPEPSPRINLHFCTDDGAYAFASIENTQGRRGPGSYCARMRLPENFLNGKTYIVTIYVTSFEPTHVHALLKDVLILNVIDDLGSITRQTYNGIFPGAVRPLLDWEVRSLEAAPAVS
jgi:lipopolysaccharide transport system ATP-binding protein